MFPRLGIRDAYRMQLGEALRRIGSQWKEAERQTNRGAFLFCYQTRSSQGLASKGVSYDLTEVVGAPAAVGDYHYISDWGLSSCVSESPDCDKSRYDWTHLVGRSGWRCDGCMVVSNVFLSGSLPHVSLGTAYVITPPPLLQANGAIVCFCKALKVHGIWKFGRTKCWDICTVQ